MKKIQTITAVASALVLVLGLGACSQTAPTKQSSTAQSSTAEASSKKIIAHRGACAYLPEHTLEAYSMAHAMGADYIEADVNITKDGVPVVVHDIHLDTTTNVSELFPDRKRDDGRYYVVDFTLAEIKQLDVHERIDLETNKAVFDGRFPVGDSHFEVPTLEEEIQLIQGLNKSTGRDVGIYPELKFPDFYAENGFDIGEITLNLLDKYGYNTEDSNCYIQSFGTNYLKSFNEKFKPKCKLIQLLGEAGWDETVGDDVPYVLSAEGLKEIAEYADGIAPWIDQILDEDGKQSKNDIVLNENLVADAHDAGLEVHPYTVRSEELPKYVENTDEFIRKLFFEVNVDGLFTDFTDLGVKAKNEGPLKK